MSPRIYKTSPWSNTATFYRSRSDFVPMLHLVERIIASPYVHGLYANTSMWTLQIVQTPEYDPDGEILRIQYDPALREFTFELQETTSTLYKRWSRKCSAHSAFQTFERFLKLKKWFTAL
jgi:hypothetical protein